MQRVRHFWRKVPEISEGGWNALCRILGALVGLKLLFNASLVRPAVKRPSDLRFAGEPAATALSFMRTFRHRRAPEGTRDRDQADRKGRAPECPAGVTEITVLGIPSIELLAERIDGVVLNLSEPAVELNPDERAADHVRST